MKKFLSLKGGGIRGIVQAYALQKLEEITGKQIYELFDLIGGTSTGGILAILLSTGRYTAKEAGEFYSTYGKDIFYRSFSQKIKSIGGIRDERYSNEGLLNLLKKYLTETKTMKSLRVPTMVFTSDTYSRQPVILKSWKHPGTNTLLWHACQQTSAAPVYFECAPATSHIEARVSGRIDGGVYANDPSTGVLAEGIKMFSEKIPEHTPSVMGNFTMVSFGNGQHTRPILYDECKDYGILQWGVKLPSIFMNEPNRYHNHNTKVLTEALGGDSFDFDGGLKIANDDMDDPSARNILALREEAKLIYDTSAFDALASVLS